MMILFLLLFSWCCTWRAPFHHSQCPLIQMMTLTSHYLLTSLKWILLVQESHLDPEIPNLDPEIPNLLSAMLNTKLRSISRPLDSSGRAVSHRYVTRYGCRYGSSAADSSAAGSRRRTAPASLFLDQLECSERS
jgi:hypothetical protein